MIFKSNITIEKPLETLFKMAPQTVLCIGMAGKYHYTNILEC